MTDEGNEDASTLLKRSRSDQDDDSEDSDSSLVSPSPPPGDTIKHDDVPQAPRDVITVETKIKSTNKGFAMLAKLGWSEGQPLGLSGDGRVDPIPFQIKNDLTGLGKINQDVRMIETTVSQRRELDSERQRKETQDQRKAREDIAAKRAAVKSEITDTLKPFYCSLCDKQFQTVAQYDEHTNSYAHHHKARLKGMQANARLVDQGELEKRKEKERKREEKELRKLAKAQGIKMAKPVTAGPASTLAPTSDTGATNEAKPSGFKKAGWAAVTAVPKPPETVSARLGRAAPPPDDPTLTASPASRSLPASDAPLFRAGGWASLDSGNSQYLPPPPTPLAPLSTPPPPPADAPPPSPLPSDRHLGHSRNPTPPLNALPSTRQSWGATPDSYPLPQPLPSTSLRAPLPPSLAAPTRSGWQQWKQGNRSKRR